MKYAGLIFDHSPHYIDHLAPFCAWMNWPLIVLDEEIANLCRTFYPKLQLIQTLECPETLVTCDNHAILKTYFPKLHSRILWLPHGQSDKGWKSPFFQALSKESLLLVYGQKMRDVLAFHKIAIPHHSVGNFRYQFFEQNRAFYHRLMTAQFGEKRFILYAPTWEDTENNGTFFDAFPKLIKAIPAHQFLLIKLHPNTYRKFPAHIERYKGLLPLNAAFLEDFPPIYPLLERTDIYIGDMSSIGYDFLPFNKPLYFLRKELTDDPSTHLMQCGKQVLFDEINTLFQQPITAVDHKSFHHYTFDPTPSPQNLQHHLC